MGGAIAEAEPLLTDAHLVRQSPSPRHHHHAARGGGDSVKPGVQLERAHDAAPKLDDDRTFLRRRFNLRFRPRRFPVHRSRPQPRAHNLNAHRTRLLVELLDLDEHAVRAGMGQAPGRYLFGQRLGEMDMAAAAAGSTSTSTEKRTRCVTPFSWV